MSFTDPKNPCFKGLVSAGLYQIRLYRAAIPPYCPSKNESV